MKSLPPMNELFDMAGMELPEYLGKDKERELQKRMAAAEKTAEPPAPAVPEEPQE